MFVRLALALLFFGSILYMPWYISIVLALGVLVYSAGYEVIIGGLLLDILYAAPVPSYFENTYLFTILFTLFFIASFYIKRYLVFYTNRE